ncbi:MAG: hypothetical protein H0T92_03830 [Pyrinomonadaceae bacterium]|nr:hypothetical protein [Pyrinomonadaceae bacterium]
MIVDEPLAREQGSRRAPPYLNLYGSFVRFTLILFKTTLRLFQASVNKITRKLKVKGQNEKGSNESKIKEAEDVRTQRLFLPFTFLLLPHRLC